MGGDKIQDVVMDVDSQKMEIKSLGFKMLKRCGTVGKQINKRVLGSQRRMKVAQTEEKKVTRCQDHGRRDLEVGR